jgi:hypothetical protein
MKGLGKKITHRLNRHIRLALINTKRKIVAFRENIILISLSSMILITGFIGTLVLSKTSTHYIHKAQTEHVIAIGSPEIINNVSSGYEAFSNTQNPFSKDQNLTQSSFNLTAIQPSITSILEDYNIETWESRIITIQTVFEKQGFDIVNPDPNVTTEDQYYSYGQGNRTRITPIQGINYDNVIFNWEYQGKFEEKPGFACIGDTIAGEIFEKPIKQRLGIKNNISNEEDIYQINSVIIDSFNFGNSVYISLDYFRQKWQLPNYSNLILIDYSSIARSEQESQLFTDLESLLKDTSFKTFSYQDLTGIFNQNIKSVKEIYHSTLIISLIIGLFILFVVYEYQKVRVIEDKRDFQIIRAVGGKFSDISRPIFYQLILTVGLGILIGLSAALYILLFFLLEDAIYPSIVVPLATIGTLFTFFILVSLFSAKFLTKKHLMVEDLTV